VLFSKLRNGSPSALAAATLFVSLSSPAWAGDFDCDTFDDGVDNCETIWQPDQADLDGDGLGDLCDPDRDGDGVADAEDNCPALANAGQDDFDGDGFGQLCDADFLPVPPAEPDGVFTFDNIIFNSLIGTTSSHPDWDDFYREGDYDADGEIEQEDIEFYTSFVVPAWVGTLAQGPPFWLDDSDGDGVVAIDDNCPTVYNPGQEDGDGDGRGDLCDAPTYDGDCTPDVSDNCTDAANENQADSDDDGFGDECDCDPDQDGLCAGGGTPGPSAFRNFDADGWVDVKDNCPAEPNPAQADSDEDGEGDLCEPSTYAQNPPGFAPTAFTIVLMPDTQHFNPDDGTQNYDNGLAAIPKLQADWICQNRAALNIVLVSHLGDVVHTLGQSELRQRVSDALLKVEACGVPYSVVPGNHDQEDGWDMGPAVWNYTTYRQTFPGTVDRWANSPYFLEWSPFISSCRITNNCEEVNTASIIETNVGFEFLHLGIEAGWRHQQALFDDWVFPTIDANAGMPIMVTSHAMISTWSVDPTPCVWSEEQRCEIEGTLDCDDPDPEELVAGSIAGAGFSDEQMLNDEADVFFTAGGHTLPGGECSAETPYADYGGVKRVDAFANYQNQNPGRFPGEGWLRYCTFDVVNDDVSCRSYSPHLKTVGRQDLTHTDLGLANRFSFPPPWDADGDGLADPLDNCSLVANPSQQNDDAVQDAYGNLCDCDYDGDEDCDPTDTKYVIDDMCVTTPTFYNSVVNCGIRIFQGITPWPNMSGFATDFDGNGTVAWQDVVLHVAQKTATGGLPGPGGSPIP